MCVITAYGVQCLVAGCRGSDAGQQAVRLGRGMLHECTTGTGSFPGVKNGRGVLLTTHPLLVLWS